MNNEEFDMVDVMELAGCFCDAWALKIQKKDMRISNTVYFFRESLSAFIYHFVSVLESASIMEKAKTESFVNFLLEDIKENVMENIRINRNSSGSAKH